MKEFVIEHLEFFINFGMVIIAGIGNLLYAKGVAKREENSKKRIIELETQQKKMFDENSVQFHKHFEEQQKSIIEIINGISNINIITHRSIVALAYFYKLSNKNLLDKKTELNLELNQLMVNEHNKVIDETITISNSIVAGTLYLELLLGKRIIDNLNSFLKSLQDLAMSYIDLFEQKKIDTLYLEFKNSLIIIENDRAQIINIFRNKLSKLGLLISQTDTEDK